jgi:(p)ppGpp synthase/HD superfamily hydrolase
MSTKDSYVSRANAAVQLLAAIPTLKRPGLHDDHGMGSEASANPRYLQALEFAESRHRRVQQARKGTQFPYLVHPSRVAEVLERFECGEDMVVAEILHDTVEDAGVTRQEIATAFGERVAQLVDKASEPDKSLPWRERKQHTIDRVRPRMTSRPLI